MHSDYPLTIIIRHRKENPKKCSILPLKQRPDLQFFHHPVRNLPPLAGYVRLAMDGPPLTIADVDCGLLLLDGSWRRVRDMLPAVVEMRTRSLSGYRTAYPRVSSLGTDPEGGLASVEALYVAYHILNRPTAGLLDHYYWAAQFLRLNGLDGPADSPPDASAKEC